MRPTFSGLLIGLALLGLAAPGRAQTYWADLSGPAEAPPNASPGIGHAVVTINQILHTMRVQVVFSGLTSGVTAAHIHASTATPFAGTAGVATQTPTFTGFPSGVTAGSYDVTFDTTLLSTYRAVFVTTNGGTALSAEAALFAGIAQNRAYVNVHTTAFPGGEIRGFLVAAPEPGTFALAALGGIGALALRRRRR